jgi:AraC-like DNA-binding protein
MNKAAFAVILKKITNKTYFEFLNEIRIGYACKMLIEDKVKTSQILPIQADLTICRILIDSLNQSKVNHLQHILN